MSKRIFRPFLYAVVLCVVVAAFVVVNHRGGNVYAGGWATITVTDLPDAFVVGQPVQLTFTIRQHGVRLMDDLTPSLEAVNGTEKVSASVSRTGTNYHANFSLPKPGMWTITIKSSFGPNDITLLPMQALASKQAATAIAETERGRRLYVAKGCLQCHKNDKAGVDGRFPWATDLTSKHYSNAYLAQVLSNPQTALAPPKNERMPNLNLNPGEISALTAFLNAGRQTAKN